MSTHLLTDPKRAFDALDAFPDSFLNLTRDKQRISLTTYRLLAKGKPVATAAIAEEAGVTEERVRDCLDRWPGVYRDDEGRVIGYWGLAIPRTDHQLKLEGRTVHAWCAWDALFLPALLGETADVTSRIPNTDETVRLTVSPSEARSADGRDVYVSFLEPEEEKLAEDVIGTFCHYVFFFPSLTEGKRWVAEHPGTYLLPLDLAFELGRRKNARQYEEVSG